MCLFCEWEWAHEHDKYPDKWTG